MGGAQMMFGLNNAAIRYPQFDAGVCLMILGLALFWAVIGVAAWVIL